MPAQLALSGAGVAVDATEAPTPTRNPNRPLSQSQRLRRMQAGKRRADARRRKDAVRHVRTYRAWLKRTNDWPAARAFACIPHVPSDHEYRLARGDA